MLAESFYQKQEVLSAQDCVQSLKVLNLCSKLKSLSLFNAKLNENFGNAYSNSKKEIFDSPEASLRGILPFLANPEAFGGLDD